MPLLWRMSRNIESPRAAGPGVYLSHQGELGPAGAFSPQSEKQAARTSDAVGAGAKAFRRRTYGFF